MRMSPVSGEWQNLHWRLSVNIPSKPVIQDIRHSNMFRYFNTQLILLDVMMPRMDGMTTLDQLQEIPQRANTLLIFITAKVQPDETAQYMSLAAVGVTAKPFDLMELIAGIEHNRTHDHEQ